MSIPMPELPTARHDPVPEFGLGATYVLVSGELLLQLVEAANPDAEWIDVEWGKPQAGSVTWHEPKITVRRP